MNTAVELLEQLANSGVAVKVDGGQLLIDDPGRNISNDLRSTLREHKADVMKQIVINQVAAWSADGLRLFNDQEFTDRLLILQRAHRNGVIDEATVDQGLGFLLDNWKGNQQK